MLSYEAELCLKRGLTSQAEAALGQALPLLDAKIPNKSRQHFHKLQYEVGVYGERPDLCEQAVEKLWALGGSSKL
jgi:hypothetical protein